MKHMYPHHPERSGQIALIALLAVVVMMTVGISLYSRSTLDVSLSRQQDLAAQVYQAAEGGVEAALGEDFSTITSSRTVQTGNVTYTISPQSQLATRVEEGESLQIKTNPATTTRTRTLPITWGKGLSCPTSLASPSDTTPPPLLIRVYNSTSGTVTARNYGISPCTYGTQDFEKPASITSNADGFTYNLLLEINDARVSIQPMYASTEITISGVGDWLPTQFYRIVSVASASATTVARESAALEVTRTLPQWPAFMDYVLYSGGTIVK